MPLTDVERREVQRLLVDAAESLDTMKRQMDRAIRESDRRAEEYLPILRRAGLVPPARRWSRWL
ncbi:MAG TPA: hypothetical protein VKB25_14440 [Conexibacter sp.]|nr:hypothetical protein [Conexibacter sp.]